MDGSVALSAGVIEADLIGEVVGSSSLVAAADSAMSAFTGFRFPTEVIVVAVRTTTRSVPSDGFPRQSQLIDTLPEELS
jgi:hypothetical protein